MERVLLKLNITLEQVNTTRQKDGIPERFNEIQGSFESN
jgi:hypothetical protein